MYFEILSDSKLTESEETAVLHLLNNRLKICNTLEKVYKITHFDHNTKIFKLTIYTKCCISLNRKKKWLKEFYELKQID